MTMRKAVIWSALMHIVGVAVMWFGVPSPGFESVEQVVVIAVDIADFSETRERKAPRLKPKPKPPEPVEETPPEPPPAPKEPELAMVPPPPMPAQEPPEPVPGPAPAEAAEDKPKVLLPARPRPKPTPPKDDFDSVLKTVELLEQDEPAKKPPPEVEESDDFLDDLATWLDDPEPPPEEHTQLAPVLGNRLTASEEDAIRRQIKPCWNTAALVGARNPEELVVTLRLKLDRDGTVISVKVLDTARQRRDKFFRAAADSARRAVQNHRCTPLILPPGKYDQWKDIVMDFDPAIMVGR